MIREAKLEDAKSIVTLNIKEWINTYKNIFPDDFLNNLKITDESIEKCQKKIKEYIVYEIDNKIVGFLRYGKNKKNYSEEYAEIYALYVNKTYQKKHIGSELIKYAFSKLKDNYKYVLISTLKENSANEFYQKIGGKFIGKSEFLLDDKAYLENVYEFKLDKKID